MLTLFLRRCEIECHATLATRQCHLRNVCFFLSESFTNAFQNSGAGNCVTRRASSLGTKATVFSLSIPLPTGNQQENKTAPMDHDKKVIQNCHDNTQFYIQGASVDPISCSSLVSFGKINSTETPYKR